MFNWTEKHNAIGGLEEPMTAITDLMLSLMAFLLAVRIHSYKELKESNDWHLFFLFTGYSTLIGGIAHALPEKMINPVHILFWTCMQICTGISVYFAERATVRSEIRSSYTRISLNRLFLAKLLIFIPAVFYFRSFACVAINSSIGIIFLVASYFPVRDGRYPYKLLIFSGLLFSAGTVMINRTRYSPAWWFNYNDLSHVFICIGLLLIHFGIRQKFKTYSLYL